MSTSFFSNKKQTIHAHGRVLDVSKPKIMGIINVTPDSFYDGNKYLQKDQIKKRVQQCVTEGADIIDVGAYSSRPGAKNITAEQERQRLAVALEVLAEVKGELWVSVDTFRSEVAKWAVETYQVDIVNDISAGEMDEKMFETIAKLEVPYIMMHMQGTPQNMQDNPVYKNSVEELLTYFQDKLEVLKRLEVKDVMIDPGFGFGKTVDHNYEIFAGLKAFLKLKAPVLIGVSRKSMIQKLLNVSADDALNGTTALNMLALQNGANILRVHDVKEAKEVVQLYEKLNLIKDNS